MKIVTQRFMVHIEVFR